jgi:hypothetical protein
MPVLKAGTAVEVRVVALPPQQSPPGPAQGPAPPQASQVPSSPQPAAPPAAAAPPSAPAFPTLAATVAGTTSAGQPIVTTERGVMVLNTRTPLPHGTQVAIGLPTVRPAPAEPFDPLRGQDWPALRETLEVLSKADPTATRSLANAVLPQANARLAGALLAFTGAVKKGDVRAWLGEEAAKSLEKLGRADLLEKLEDDFKKLARQVADIPPGDWKPYSVPFSDGTELHRILMHVRQPGAEEVDEDAGGADGHGARANRFLIDLTLSRIGELQLDGLIRPRRFDLILRTHMPLPPDMRHEIGKLFNDSLDALGMAGAVSFQAGTQGWVAIQPGPSGRVGMSA